MRNVEIPHFPDYSRWHPEQGFDVVGIDPTIEQFPIPCKTFAYSRTTALERAGGGLVHTEVKQESKPKTDSEIEVENTRDPFSIKSIPGKLYDWSCRVLGKNVYVGTASSMLIGFGGTLNFFNRLGNLSQMNLGDAGASLSLGIFCAYTGLKIAGAAVLSARESINRVENEEQSPHHESKRKFLTLIGLSTGAYFGGNIFNFWLHGGKVDASHSIHSQNAGSLENKIRIAGIDDLAGKIFEYSDAEVLRAEQYRSLLKEAAQQVRFGYDHKTPIEKNLYEVLDSVGFSPEILMEAMLLVESRALDVDNGLSYGPLQLNLKSVVGRPTVEQFKAMALQEKLTASLKVLMDCYLYFPNDSEYMIQAYNYVYRNQDGSINYNKRPYGRLVLNVYQALLNHPLVS